MNDLLAETLRRHAESQPVPPLDLDHVLARGRRVRGRRSTTRRITALTAAAVIAGVLLVAIRPGAAPDLQVRTTISAADVELASSAYRTGGAFSRGDTLWFSDPSYSVDLGRTIQLMYYTADGVIAGVTDDNNGDATRAYVYVGTDGSVRPLDLPGDVVPGADAQADRLAYLTHDGPGYRVHVVQASTGREIATQRFVATYTWAGWDMPPIGLTGDHVVIGADDGQHVIDWRTGERLENVPGVQLPSTGGGRALGDLFGATTYEVETGTALRSTDDLTAADEPGGEPWASNELSPDGRFVLTVGFGSLAGSRPTEGAQVNITEVATGHRITLPGDSRTYGWTPDGDLMRADATSTTTCDAATGHCVDRTAPSGAGRIHMAGRYLGS